jgi:hypothetical protein
LRFTIELKTRTSTAVPKFGLTVARVPPEQVAEDRVLAKITEREPRLALAA